VIGLIRGPQHEYLHVIRGPQHEYFTVIRDPQDERLNMSRTRRYIKEFHPRELGLRMGLRRCWGHQCTLEKVDQGKRRKAATEF
jgi:hypothetical protein